MGRIAEGFDNVVDAVIGVDPMMRADGDMKKVLGAIVSLGPKAIEKCTPEEARAQPLPADAVKRILEDERRGLPDTEIRVHELQIPVNGAVLEARLYSPPIQGLLPLVVYYHGGGWVIADLDDYDGSARAIARESGAAVLSVHYRQGPENRFPTAHEDAFAAYTWALEHGPELGIDDHRVAVAGESAGGNMATGVCLMARDRGVQMPVHQLLIYPVGGTNMSAVSVQDNAHAKPLNAAMLEWFMAYYLNSQQDLMHPLMNLVAADLRGLPGATVITAEIDPLRSSGQLLAQKLLNAGVQVAERDYDGVTHEFFGMGAVVEKAMEAQVFAGEQLRRSFNRA